MTRGKKWEEWEEKYLIDNYNIESKQNICKKINKTYSSICIKARRLKIVSKKERWTKEEKEKLNKFDTLNITDLSKLFEKRSKSSIKRMLFANGIKKYKILRNNKLNKYSFNDNYFSNLTHNNSYIAGWIASDGHLDKNGVLEWHLSKKDINVLDFFKKELNFTGPIYNEIQNGKEYCRICIFGAYNIQKDLYKYWNIPVGVKTSILQPPNKEIISNDMLLSYVCGIISGDGSIGYYKAKNNTKQLNLTIAGNMYIIEWISNLFYDIIGIRRKIRKSKNSKGYTIQYRCIQALNIINKIKELPISFWLDRKFNIPELNQNITTYK